MAVKKTIDINVKNNFKETEDDLKGVNSELNETTAATESVAASGATATTSMQALGASKFTGLIASIGGVVKSLFTLRGAIMATGIGALVLAVLSLKAAFTRTEAGQNKFAKALAVVGSIFENVMDVVGDLGEIIINVFENPIESLKAFGRAVVNNIMTRLRGILEFLPAIGKALGKVFRGQFTAAGKIATNALGKIVLGAEDTVSALSEVSESFKNFTLSLTEDGRKAIAIADKRAKAEKLERALIVERAKEQAKISALQLKSRQEELFTEEQRQEFAKQAAARTDALLQKEEAALRLKFEAIKAENKLADSNKEALDAEANAQAELINLQTRRLDAQKTATKFLNTLRDELAAKNKARRKVEEKAILFGVEFTKQMSNEEIAELTKAAEEKYKIIVKEGQDRVKLQNQQDKLRLELMDEGFDKEFAKLVAKSEAQLLLAKDDKDLQLAIEEDFKAKQEELEKKFSDKKIKEAQTVAKAENDIRDAQIENISAGINLVKSLAGENKKLQGAALIAENAVAVAKIIINTQVANAAAKLKYAALPGGVALAASEITANKVSAGIGIASAVAATAQGLSALKTGGSPTSGGGLGGDAPNNEPQAPQFNVVGDSGVNQLAELQQQPAQAYVVSGEVTTAQALDRNRVQNATL